MTLVEAIISGVVQGITEFLPISSSGHLVILHKLIGLKEPQIAFDIFLHGGTLAAIFIVFWRDIVHICAREKRVIFFILIATAVTVVFVLIFSKVVEAAFSDVRGVGAMLIVTGSWLIFGSFVRFGSEGMSRFKAMLIGLAQGISALPGISRSGATISTALFLGLDSKMAARFSFLLAIPAISGAFLFKIKDVALDGFGLTYLVGFATSCIIGVLSLKLLLRVMYRNRLHVFGVYCIVAGVMVLVFL